MSTNISKKEKTTGEVLSKNTCGNNKITSSNDTLEKEKSQVTFFADLDAIAGILKMIKDCLSVIGNSKSKYDFEFIKIVCLSKQKRVSKKAKYPLVESDI